MAIYQLNAGPGTGKTHTLVLLSMLLKGQINIPSNATPEQTNIYKTLTTELPSTNKIAFFAHTNTIVDEIKARAKGTQVSTIHSAGMSALTKMYGYQNLDRTRIDDFITALTGQSLRRLPPEDKRQWIACKHITEKLKQEFMEPTEDNLAYLKIKYPELILQNIPKDWDARCQQLLVRSLHPNKKLDYSDMVWLAAKRITHPTHDIGLVDESQDISASTYAFLSRYCRNLVFCGDPNQAINAFAGADEDIFYDISDKAEAIFPLKTTFRLPPNIITKANRLIPNSVLPGPNKIPGKEVNIGYTQFQTTLSQLSPLLPNGKLNTITLCRTNAPLISLALILTQKNIPVKLADKELPKKLIAKLKYLGITTIPSLSRRLEDHLTQVNRRKNPMLTMITEDFVTCILELSAGCSSIEQLKEKITLICTPNPNKSAHLFSTIHKGKGLEADHCFIINPPIEHPMANQNPIGMKQERNVHFVGITRTRSDTYWVCK